MFYPVNSLKIGGQFYYCWVADTWPLRFANMTSRQIMLTNVPNICEELREIIATESGRPYQRFSLRLSIRIVHGLVRIYNRQCNIFLEELCLMYVDIYKYSKRGRRERNEEGGRRRRRVRAPRRVPAIEQRPQQVEEEAVQPVDERSITLREDLLLHPQPARDGFVMDGEPPENLLQSLEMMLAPEPAADLFTDRSMSARAPPHGRFTASPHPDTGAREPTVLNGTFDLTNLLGRDVTEEQLLDAPLPPPASPAAAPPLLSPAVQLPAPPEMHQPPPRIEEPLILEELVGEERRVHARRRHRRLVDKCIMLSNAQIRKQLEDVASNRTKVFLTDVKWVSAEESLRVSARGWRRGRPMLSPALVRLHSRNLARAAQNFTTRSQAPPPLAIENEVPPPPPAVEYVAPPPPPAIQLEAPQPPLFHEIEAPMPPPAVEFAAPLPPPAVEFEVLPPPLALELEAPPPPPTLERVVPQPLPQEQAQESPLVSAPGSRPIADPNPSHKRDATSPPPPTITRAQKRQKRSEEAQAPALEASNGHEERASSLLNAARLDSTNETPLGSLDRTRVSLGEPETPTPSRVHIRLEWGPEGTMRKIIDAVRDGVRPLSVEALLARGPPPPPGESLAQIKACCFGSVLKLKQARLVNLRKNQETLAIVHMELGERFLN